MMKKILFTAVLALFSIAAFSQDVFQKGDKVLNLGIGFGDAYHTSSFLKTSVPPISASFEYGIIDNLLEGKASIGVGGYLGYTSQKWKNSYNIGGITINSNSNSSISYTILGARGSFHYQFIDKLDTYAGVMLGYEIVSDNVDNYGSGLATSGYVGARYYLTDNIAVNSELGYGISILSLGVSFKF